MRTPQIESTCNAQPFQRMQLAKVMLDAIELLPHSNHFGNGHSHCSGLQTRSTGFFPTRSILVFVIASITPTLSNAGTAALCFSGVLPIVMEVSMGICASDRAHDRTVDAKSDETLSRLNTT